MPPAASPTLSAEARDGLERLNAAIPLAARQRALPAALRDLHRAALLGFARRGAPPEPADLRPPPGSTLADALRSLAAEDLVVLGDAPLRIAGAYPFTTEPTPHEVEIDGRRVGAMCALDALSVAPMLDTRTVVRSACHVSGARVRVSMHGGRVEDAVPAGVQVAIEWTPPCGHTAHSLCRRMVFIADESTARTWCAGGEVDRTRYTLADAVAFGAAFFRPLMEG